MIKYINIDKLASNYPNHEVYRDGKMITDLHNVCTVQDIDFDDDQLTLLLKVTWEKDPVGSLELGEECSLKFTKAKIKKLNVEGKAMDDLGEFSDITTLDENSNRLIIRIASSIEIWVECAKVEMVLSTDVELSREA